jgi:putative restriction endonuclease
MPLLFSGIKIGSQYDRDYLAEKLGYRTRQAISRGVITPNKKNIIILFVTKEKASDATQYIDYIDGDLLFWEGETSHSNDKRIINSAANNDSVHLFYREIHHRPFIYKGTIELVSSEIANNKPSSFVFKLNNIDQTATDITQAKPDFYNLSETEKDSLVRSRIGQGDFRRKLFLYWKGCSVTGVCNTSFLKASHIKPWRYSNNNERLDLYNGLLLIPNLDLLFDLGYISFMDNGRIILSKILSNNDMLSLDIKKEYCLRKVSPLHLKYLKYHRDNVFI